MRSNRGEKRLLAGFAFLVALTVSIGLISLLQIHALARTIRQFGGHHIPVERAILGMKTNNTLYAMGVRNYVFWRTSKYLQAVSLAADINTTQQALAEFRQALSSYTRLADSHEPHTWVTRLGESASNLERMGQEITRLADSDNPDRERVNKLLLTFENSSYKLDEFLTETLSTHNLGAIDAQLRWADDQRRASLIVLVFSVSCSVMLGLGIARFVYASLKQERQIRERLTQRMLNLEEEERKNLSRQIHDQLSQDLSALKIYLGLIEEGLPADLTELRERLEKSKKILGTLIEGGHHISELLRPSELDELGLVESIATLMAEHQAITGRTYRFSRPPAPLTLSSEHSLALYRVVQEALTNITKHSNATCVDIALTQNDRAVSLTIHDDGTGFAYEDILKPQPRRRKDDVLKLGLLGLRERMELLGGVLRIDTAPGEGTTIMVQVPVPG